jgi:hypothetical protein
VLHTDGLSQTIGLSRDFGIRRYRFGTLAIFLLMPPTLQRRTKPGASLTKSRLLAAGLVGRTGGLFWRWLDCPAATARRTTESGTGKADHDIVGGTMSPCLVL